MSDDSDDNAPSPALHWYDFVCPFCYIGQSRTAILVEAGIEVVSLPLQAHPDVPVGGICVGPRRGPRYQMLEREAEAAGLMLRWPARIPNSRKALAVAEWVRRNQPTAFAGVQRKLFEAHFVLGEDIDDQAVIDLHGTAEGVNLAALHTALTDGSAYVAASHAETAGRQHGVDGTPAWLLDGQLIVGLQPAAEFERFARHALTQRALSERTRR